MTKKEILFVPSGITSGKNNMMPAPEIAEKSAFSFLLFILFSCMVKCLLPGHCAGSDAPFAGRTGSASAFVKSDLQNIPGAYLLSEALPRGRILMTKILRPPAGSIYIAQYNPFFNRQILHT